MTNAQKVALRISKVRERLNEISGIEGDAFTDEIRAESDTLQTEYADLENRHRAAIIAQGEEEARARKLFESESPEDSELRSMIDDSNLGAIFSATLEHRQTDGREAELQKHFKLAANQIPLALLETRAVTPAPANVQGNQQPIIPGVFPLSCAAFLGVDMPTVPVGEAIFPVLTTNATVEVLAEGAAGTETTGSFSADALSPSRLQASFFYSREDRARFAGMDESLRMNLSDSLSDAFDKQVLAGANGLTTGTNLANHNASAVTAFEDYRDHFAYSRVDGTFAATTADLRVVMGNATYAHAAKTYRANNADDSALDSLMRVTSGVKVSAHVPAAVSNKQDSIIRRGVRRDMVAPIWEGVTLIPDEVTKAATGQIVITAVMLHAVKLLRSDGFYKQQTQHA